MEDWKELLKKFDANMERMQATDKKAKAAGSLVGRYIQEPFADGYAYYLIFKENKKTVRIQRVTGIGDDWTIPYWGDTASISKDFAMQNIGRRDALHELFSRKS